MITVQQQHRPVRLRHNQIVDVLRVHAPVKKRGANDLAETFKRLDKQHEGKLLPTMHNALEDAIEGRIERLG